MGGEFLALNNFLGLSFETFILKIFPLNKNFTRVRKRMTNSHLRKMSEKFMWQRRKIAVDKKSFLLPHLLHWNGEFLCVFVLTWNFIVEKKVRKVAILLHEKIKRENHRKFEIYAFLFTKFSNFILTQKAHSYAKLLFEHICMKVFPPNR